MMNSRSQGKTRIATHKGTVFQGRIWSQTSKGVGSNFKTRIRRVTPSPKLLNDDTNPYRANTHYKFTKRVEKLEPWLLPRTAETPQSEHYTKEDPTPAPALEPWLPRTAEKRICDDDDDESVCYEYESDSPYLSDKEDCDVCDDWRILYRIKTVLEPRTYGSGRPDASTIGALNQHCGELFALLETIHSSKWDIWTWRAMHGRYKMVWALYDELSSQKRRKSMQLEKKRHSERVKERKKAEAAERIESARIAAIEASIDAACRSVAKSAVRNVLLKARKADEEKRKAETLKFSAVVKCNQEAAERRKKAVSERAVQALAVEKRQRDERAAATKAEKAAAKAAAREAAKAAAREAAKAAARKAEKAAAKAEKAAAKAAESVEDARARARERLESEEWLARKPATVLMTTDALNMASLLLTSAARGFVARRLVAALRAVIRFQETRAGLSSSSTSSSTLVRVANAAPPPPAPPPAPPSAPAFKARACRYGKDCRFYKSGHCYFNHDSDDVCKAVSMPEPALEPPTAQAASTDECPYCYNAFNDDRHHRIALSCGHVLCSACSTRLPDASKCWTCSSEIRFRIRLFT